MLAILIIFGFVLLVEIKKRKQSEESLRESEKKIRATIDATPFPVAIVDLQDDRIFYWSHSAFDLFGHTAPTASEWYQIAYPDLNYRRDVISRWKSFLEIARKSGQPINTGEYRVACKDGSERICEIYATFLPDSLIVTFNDITEQKRPRTAMKESEQLFRELFDNMSSGVAIYESPDNGQSFIFRNLNKAGLEPGQRRKDEVVGREVREVFPGVEALGLFEIFKRVWKTGIPEHHPSRMYKDDKIVLWVENYVCKLPSGELVAIYEDTTARKKAEEAKAKLERQLLQSQKIESIGNLAGGIAHDFNNILTSIIGFTELALDEVAKGIPLENNLQEVYTAGKRARDLVKQILAFARQSDVVQKPIRLDTIAKEVLKLIRSTMPTTIEIKKNIESNSLIMGNPTQVHQLLINLCTNAPMRWRIPVVFWKLD